MHAAVFLTLCREMENYRLKHTRQEVTPVYKVATTTKWQQFLKDFGRSEGIYFNLYIIHVEYSFSSVCHKQCIYPCIQMEKQLFALVSLHL